jgi:uncharacterized membrane protein HdeD (DUF308 family)
MVMRVSDTVEIARWWWSFLLRGVLAIVFGILVFVSPPTLTIEVLVLFVGAWMLVDGVFDIVAAFQTRERERSWWLALLEGVAGIVAGLIALIFPALAADVFLLLISAWAIVTGVIEIVTAIRMREQISGEFWLALAGVASIAFGLLLFLFPVTGALTILWLIGGYAIAFGIMLILLGWRLRGINELAKRDAAHDYSRGQPA